MKKGKRAYMLLLAGILLYSGFFCTVPGAEMDEESPYHASKSYVFTYEDLADPELAKLYGQEENDYGLPDRFCLSEQMDLVVENQGASDLCDLYADVKCIETNYAISYGKSLDLSETYFDYLSSVYFYGGREPQTLSDGSTMFYAARFGAALEQDIPKGDYSGKLTAIEEAVPACVVTATIDFTDLTQAEEIDSQLLLIIKKHLMRYGSLSTDIHSPDLSAGDAYQPDNFAYYYRESVFHEELRPTHHISIVGFDDNYPKENFVVSPEHDGAFICLNSWGTDFGDKGYFYVSYETLNSFEILNGVLSTAPYCPVTEYTYAECNDYGGEIVTATKQENFYGVIYRTQSENDGLKRICLELTANPGSVRIYCNPQSGSFEKDKMIFLGETAISFWGDTLIDLEEPLKLEGEEFALVFEVLYSERMNEDFICNNPSKSKTTHEILSGHFYNGTGWGEEFSLMDYDLLLYVETVPSDRLLEMDHTIRDINENKKNTLASGDDGVIKNHVAESRKDSRVVQYSILVLVIMVLAVGVTILLAKGKNLL